MPDRVLAAWPRPGNVVFDVDGCLLLGGKPIEGAVETVKALQEAGTRILVATNNSTRLVADVADRIGDALGLPMPVGSVVTSALAALTLLGDGDGPVFVVGEAGLVATLREGGHQLTDDPETARTVVVGLDRSFDYRRLHDAARAIRTGARFVATNDDATFPSRGPDAPGAGSIVAAIERASGRRAEIAGKPHAAMVAAVRERLGPGDTWMVGDRPETDMLFARAGGWRAVLVLTGVTTSVESVPQEAQPDVALDGVGELPMLVSDG